MRFQQFLKFESQVSRAHKLVHILCPPISTFFYVLIYIEKMFKNLVKSQTLTQAHVPNSVSHSTAIVVNLDSNPMSLHQCKPKTYRDIFPYTGQAMSYHRPVLSCQRLKLRVKHYTLTHYGYSSQPRLKPMSQHQCKPKTYRDIFPYTGQAMSYHRPVFQLSFFAFTQT